MWSKFGVSCRGGTHIGHDLPCQDASLCRSGEGFTLVAAADGHGSRRHFRAQTGAELACRAACDCMERFVKQLIPGRMPAQEELQQLKQDILRTWRQAVEADAARRIWTIEELVEQYDLLDREAYDALVHDRMVLIPYGTTLAAALVTPDFWLAMQLGDGDAVLISREGEFTWPMPESRVNQGRFTASMCMADPMPEFRHCMGERLPAALLVYTDGVEKTFPPRGKEIAAFLHAIWDVARTGNDAELHAALTAVAQQGPVRDDATIAGMIDTEVVLPAPRLAALQRNEALGRIRAQISECCSTMAYNAARLQKLNRTRPEHEAAAAQMEQIVLRCSQQMSQLLAEERAWMAADEHPAAEDPNSVFHDDDPSVIWAPPPAGADGEANDIDGH